VQKQSQQLWRYQRFLLVLEYSAKPPLPPPFNPIYYLFDGIRFLIKRIHSSWQRRRHGMLDNTVINNHFSCLDFIVACESLLMEPIDRNENTIQDEFKSKIDLV
jgi:hypothetical protein